MMKAHVLLFNGYADWGIGNALAELRRLGDKSVISVGFDGSSITSLGGLRVTPDITLSDVDIDGVLIFMLPGGQLWEGDYPFEALKALLVDLERCSAPIAAICAATTVLARAGLLRNRKHTSNSAKYMAKMVPGYANRKHYVDALSVCDRSVITASSLGAVDFAAQILEELNIADADIRRRWYEAFKYGNYPDME
ncbi:MAG: thiamine biosynthesis protein ThiJ [Desulfatitalea sp.]|nr:DJ-1/PfpI family protein [Desulfatitalea sp.]NNK00177.1 thiamine biosynthesis protein ThiJ [Desulfatitalea sp.]